MKCQRCGEREAEVHFANIVRTQEHSDARAEMLCTVCANVSGTDMRNSLRALLALAPEMSAEDRRHIEGMLEKLEGSGEDPVSEA